MPDSPPSPKWHARLEWWRRIGLDACQDRMDNSVNWRTVVLFFLVSIAVLITFVVLCFDVVPGGATTWADENIWGPFVPSGTCEQARTEKMVRQPSSAISASSYTFVGIFIAMLTWFDLVIAFQRFRDRANNVPPRPYCKGPRGEEHSKVTAVRTDNQVQFVSVDPEYLRGSVPSLLRREPAWGVLLSSSVCFLGVSGYLSHASNAKLAYKLDETAWFSVVLAFVAYSLARTVSDAASPRANVCGFCEQFGVVCRVQCDSGARLTSSRLATLVLITCTVSLDVVAMLFFDLEPTSTSTWVGLSVLAGIAAVSLNLHYFGRREEVDVWFELGLGSVLTFALALLFRHYDTRGLCVDPSGYFQAHAIWHVLSAIGLLLAYLTLRSDMWMYDLLHAREERRTAALDEAYRVPGALEFDLQSPQSFTRRPSQPQPPPPPPAPRPSTLERDSSQRRSDGRPRTLERDSSRRSDTGAPQRPRTLEREDSGSSRTSSKRLENLRAQAKNRDSRKTQRTLDSDSDLGGSSIGAAYWTCPECAYEDNELTFLVCERCQAERPPLDEFVPMSVVQGYL